MITLLLAPLLPFSLCSCLPSFSPSLPSLSPCLLSLAPCPLLSHHVSHPSHHLVLTQTGDETDVRVQQRFYNSCFARSKTSFLNKYKRLGNYSSSDACWNLRFMWSVFGWWNLFFTQINFGRLQQWSIILMPKFVNFQFLPWPIHQYFS